MDPYLLIPLSLMAGLAYANGANDVSKGIATLVGSGVTHYRRAILWGTAWTVFGGLLAAFVSAEMVKTFTNGVLAEAPETHGPALALSVMAGAILWIMFATWTGLPVSTTHAITGALAGAGFMALGKDGILWGSLFHKIALPLAISPVVALTLSYLMAPAVRWSLSGWKGHCVCVFPAQSALLTVQQDGGVRMVPTQQGLAAAVDAPACDTGPKVLALRMGPDTFHWLTSGLTSLARGLNDAPKIAALMMGYTLLAGDAASAGMTPAFLLAALGMGAGSLCQGLRVTETLAEKVTKMDHLEGFSANLTTSLLVTVAARFGLPVSTTHVSTGAIIGMGVHTGIRQINWNMVYGMAGAWVITLPVSALLAAGGYFVLGRIL
jgi:PiT family inorganic phosphate transporter